MKKQERIACILWFTYQQGRKDAVLVRLGRDVTPKVPVVEDDEMKAWDDLGADEKGRFLRSAADFL